MLFVSLVLSKVEISTSLDPEVDCMWYVIPQATYLCFHILWRCALTVLPCESSLGSPIRHQSMFPRLCSPLLIWRMIAAWDDHLCSDSLLSSDSKSQTLTRVSSSTGRTVQSCSQRWKQQGRSLQKTMGCQSLPFPSVISEAGDDLWPGPIWMDMIWYFIRGLRWGGLTVVIWPARKQESRDKRGTSNRACWDGKIDWSETCGRMREWCMGRTQRHVESITGLQVMPI